MRRCLPIILALTLAALPAAAGEVTVFAAASLTNVLQELGAEWQKSPGGEKVIFNFAASSALAVQIQAGAPADLFFGR